MVSLLNHEMILLHFKTEMKLRNSEVMKLTGILKSLSNYIFNLQAAKFIMYHDYKHLIYNILTASLLRLFERDMIVKDDLVLKIHNGSKKDILQELHKITARKDFISYSMFMCFIATIGNLECFHTSDENTITYHELFGLVSQKEWKDFKDKPKIFFIDNCRTRMDKRGTHIHLIALSNLYYSITTHTYNAEKLTKMIIR